MRCRIVGVGRKEDASGLMRSNRIDYTLSVDGSQDVHYRSAGRRSNLHSVNIADVVLESTHWFWSRGKSGIQESLQCAGNQQELCYSTKVWRSIQHLM